MFPQGPIDPVLALIADRAPEVALVSGFLNSGTAHFERLGFVVWSKPFDVEAIRRWFGQKANAEYRADATITWALCVLAKERGIPLRELEALALRLEGHSAAAVARAMGVSRATVYTYWKRTRDRVGEPTIAEVAFEVQRQGVMLRGRIG